MPGASAEDIADFVTSSFRSVWALEVLLHLRRNAERGWTQSELVAALRASDAVISKATLELDIAGLVILDPDGSPRYAPASPQLDDLTGAVADLYQMSPGAVRRLIVRSAASNLQAFADSFRLRKE